MQRFEMPRSGVMRLERKGNENGQKEKEYEILRDRRAGCPGGDYDEK